MNWMFRYTPRAAVTVLLALTLASVGCGRKDTRVNSDPGPGKPSRADGGDKALRPDPNHATPPSSGTDSKVGTDSTGRPSDASGGTTTPGASSASSEKPDSPAKK